MFGIVAAKFNPNRCKPHCVLSTELRAALYGLRKVVGHESTTILSDSQNTVDWINRWKEGEAQLPNRYSLERTNSQTPSVAALS
ncbi:MAG TPA: hypothetical protein VN081_04050 [Dongiaceae bacterium]|nr:hypothetical protein [Dongiaceae bacterium]